MQKLIFATLVTLAIFQLSLKSEAFIIKTIQIDKALPALPSPDAAIAAITAQKTALVQTVQNAVTEKIKTISSLVNNLVQAKIAAKRNVINTVTGILAAKPTTITKTITFNAKPVATTTSVPPPTTTISGVSGVITTTAAQPSAYKYGRRY